MTLDEMIDFVRTHADTDAQDAPTSSLTVYARAAYNDIRRRVPQWDTFSVTETLTTVDGQTDYPLSGLSVGDIEFVTQVQSELERVEYVSWTDLLLLREGTDITYTTRLADFFTVRNGEIVLYPEPSQTGVEYTVYGYRNFVGWPDGGSSEPDLPREFDETICWSMLSRYYAAQEDVELMQLYRQEYEASVARFLSAAMRTDQVSPKIFGGSRYRRLTVDDQIKRSVEG